MRLVVEHLVGLGHKVIACVTGPGKRRSAGLPGGHGRTRPAAAAAALPWWPGRTPPRRARAAPSGCWPTGPPAPRSSPPATSSRAEAAARRWPMPGWPAPGTSRSCGCGDLPLAGCLSPPLTPPSDCPATTWECRWRSCSWSGWPTRTHHRWPGCCPPNSSSGIPPGRCVPGCGGQRHVRHDRGGWRLTYGGAYTARAVGQAGRVARP